MIPGAGQAPTWTTAGCELGAALWDPVLDTSEQAPADAAAVAREATGPRPEVDDAVLCAWIGRIVARDERALEDLYDATAARIFGLARRITRDRALAEEVVEDTYWQVWRQAPRFDAGRGRALAWLCAMARSRAIDAVRHARRFVHDALPDDETCAGGDATGPLELFAAAQATGALQRALQELDPRERQLVALAFFRGLTHEEIALQATLPLGTVKSLIRRALAQLRARLETGHA